MGLRRGRFRPEVGAALVFTLVFGAGALIARLGRAELERDQRERAVAAAEGAARSIEQELGRSLSATYALAALIRQHGRIDDFDRLASEMLPYYGGLSTLQLAPGGVIRNIHPLAGNEAALGHDLLNDPDRRFQAEEAVRTRRLTVAGPFHLVQGGVGLVGRLAVFVTDHGAGGRERFWGFVTALVRVPRLVEASRLAHLSETGYDWALSRADPQGGARVTFAGTESGAPGDPVRAAVETPNGEWLLELAPRGGWAAARTSRLWQAAAACIALISAALVFTVLRQPERLRRQVEERTADLARANALLNESQKLDGLGRLAGGVAHDFNNLLTVILGTAEVLREDLRAGRARTEDLEEIRAAGERARDLTGQLLAFARRQLIAPEVLDLNEVLRGTEKLLRRVLGEDVRLDTALASGLWRVRADRGQIGQVVLNLSVNARDAMPTGGRLLIETGNSTLGREAAAQGISPGRWVRLTVRDTGHGMTPEVRAHLFEPFFTTKPKGHGTGLGLPTVYGIVKQSGGHVHVESEEGKGAAVHVYLPPTDEAPAPARPAPAPRPVRGSETVLVVEDDPNVREVAARALRDGGYRVLAAAGPASARYVAAGEPAPIHLLLTDVVMPDSDGRTLAREIRSARPGLRVLYMSGYAEDVVARHGVLAEGVELLAKPFTPTTLLAKVRAVLDA